METAGRLRLADVFVSIQDPRQIGVGLGGMTIGAPITGWVANHYGPRWSLGLGAMAGFTAALVAVYVLARWEDPLSA